MSAQAILDSVRPALARRPGSRRAQKRASAPLTRNALIADFLAICELDPEIESLRAPGRSGRVRDRRARRSSTSPISRSCETDSHA